jgi:hypothetical protein
MAGDAPVAPTLPISVPCLHLLPRLHPRWRLCVTVHGDEIAAVIEDHGLPLKKKLPAPTTPARGGAYRRPDSRDIHAAVRIA